MKDYIIKTVDAVMLFFVVFVTFCAFLVGFGFSGFLTALFASIIGFIISSCFAGSWIVLTRILERIESIDEKIAPK